MAPENNLISEKTLKTLGHFYENPTGSRSEILGCIQRHYRTTLDYLEMLTGKTADDSFVIGNWLAYVLITDDEKIAGYFPAEMSEEAKGMVKEWDSWVGACEKETYLESRHVKERNFPWFDYMDLHENLHKFLTIDEMAKYRAIGTGLSVTDREEDLIVLDCNKRINTQPRTLDIYQRKKTLEERMIRHLESYKSS